MNQRPNLLQNAARRRPAGDLYGPSTTPKLGIYEATPGRVLLMSRAMGVRAAGLPDITVTQQPKSAISTAGSVAYGLLATASMAASAYHGVKRNKGSIGYGIWWGIMGAMFPVITPAIAVAQGFAKPA